MPFTTAAVIAGTTAATTTTVAGATFIGTTVAWGATAATIAADAALVAGGVGAFSQYQAGQEAKQLGKDQRAMNEYNAILDLREAGEILDAKGVQEARHRTAGERLKARQRVAFAKAGVTKEGTPMDTLEETAIQIETDALTIRRSGQIGARNLTASAVLQRMAGRSALTRGRRKARASQFATIGTAIGGIGRASSLRNQLET